MSDGDKESYVCMVKDEVWYSREKELWLYSAYDLQHGVRLKFFSKTPHDRNDVILLKGNLAYENASYILRAARQVPCPSSSLYLLSAEGRLSQYTRDFPDLRDDRLKNAVHSLFPNDSDEVIDEMLRYFNATDIYGINEQYSHAIQRCSVEELSVRSQLMEIGFSRRECNALCYNYRRAHKDLPVDELAEEFGELGKTIQENPYAVFYNMDVSFAHTDSVILSHLPELKDSKQRKDAFLLDSAQRLEASTGSSIFEPQELLKNLAPSGLSFSQKDIEACELLSCSGELYGSSKSLSAEEDIYEFFTDLSNRSAPSHYNTYEVRGNSGQQNAVNVALESPVSILTGGPGCGKTFTVNEVLKNIDNAVLLAPTGKAAQRMSEVTGREAATIHSFASKAAKGRVSNQPLTVIVDEASMLSIESAKLLVDSLRDQHVQRVLLVGDTDQLPAVGAGNILRDMIASQKFPVSRLTEVMRQGKDSTLVNIAHNMLDGGTIQSIRESVPDTARQDFFISQPKSSAASAITSAIQRKKFDKFVPNFNPMRDLQVLCPIKAGANGVHDMNVQLQKFLNPDSSFAESVTCGIGTRQYNVCRGDKILCTKNHYDADLVNGDIGYVREIYPDHMIADIDGKGETRIPRNVYPNIELGYAMTVHKSQGSEFPVVVTVLPQLNTPLYQRNLLYTAITRSRKLQWVLGAEDTVNKCIDNNIAVNRATHLSNLLGISQQRSVGSVAHA